MNFVILKKELKSYFQNPLNYLVAGVISLIAGWMFFNLLVHFVSNVQGIQVDERYNYDFINSVVIKFFGNINFLLLFLCPILSMKILAEEFKDQTINLLLTSKVSLQEIILNKYISLFIQGVSCFLFSVLFFVILGRLESIDYSIVLCGYLGMALNLMLYLSIGLFASSISKNMIVSALVSFTFIMFYWSVALFSQMSSNFLVSQILKYFSLIHHFEQIIMGNLSVSSLVFYITSIFVFIFLSFKALVFRCRL